MKMMPAPVDRYFTGRESTGVGKPEWGYLAHRRLGVNEWVMISLAIVGGIIAIPTLLLFAASFLLDDIYYRADKSVSFEWKAGPSPIVEVDLYEGYINVIQSHDGGVSATLTPFAVTKKSQAAAEAALGDIKISAAKVGNTIRIKTTKDPKVVMSQLKADIELRVPPDASLNLLTGHGYIYIGKSFVGAYPTSSPLALKAVKARDMGQSYIGIEAEIAPRPSLPATELDLESRHGTIVIKGDNVLISAKATGGAIEYSGQPATGRHSFETGRYEPHPDEGFRLGKGVRLELPADLIFGVDAKSASGGISCDFETGTASTPATHSLKGAVGMDPSIELRIRCEEGPVEIRKKSTEPVRTEPK
jgi:hypothetical protein